jgi:F-type H+-transporting ATPase subunit epsilon
MKLKILLPYQVFAEKTEVSRIVVKTTKGELGIWPNRLDCTAALLPGILTYENEAEGEIFIAVDQGVLVKTGQDVMISVRNAIAEKSLDQLHEAVEKEFIELDQREQNVRSVMAKMESGFIRRFMALDNDE